jgi:hypothetical protein
MTPSSLAIPREYRAKTFSSSGRYKSCRRPCRSTCFTSLAECTLVVETTGLDERTWIDHAGRPHSDQLRVEERFHRVDHDHLEISVLIDDPKMYTKPWLALDRLVFNLEPQTFDVRDMFWTPTEFQGYNKLIGNDAAEGVKDQH